MIAAADPVVKPKIPTKMMKTFFISLYQLNLFQKVIMSRVGGKTRHSNVQVRDPANDMNKSKFSEINATATV